MAILNKIPTPTSTPEPAMYVEIALALITLAVSFGLDVTAEQVGAIVAVLTLLAGLVIRHHVSPVS